MQVHWSPQHEKPHQLNKYEYFRLDVQLMSPCTTKANKSNIVSQQKVKTGSMCNAESFTK